MEQTLGIKRNYNNNTMMTLGRRAFYVVGPIVWNSPPDELRDDIEDSCFSQSLKTLLFSQYYGVPSALEVYLYMTMRYINQHFTYLFTYLLTHVGGVNRIVDNSKLSATENLETVLSSLEMP